MNLFKKMLRGIWSYPSLPCWRWSCWCRMRGENFFFQRKVSHLLWHASFWSTFNRLVGDVAQIDVFKTWLRCIFCNPSFLLVPYNKQAGCKQNRHRKSYHFVKLIIRQSRIYTWFEWISEFHFCHNLVEVLLPSICWTSCFPYLSQ